MFDSNTLLSRRQSKLLDTSRDFWEVLINEPDDPVASVEDLVAKIEINLYPTIFENDIKVEFSPSLSSSKNLNLIEIFSIHGNKVLSLDFENKQNKIFDLDLSILPERGAYVIRFIFDTGYVSKRIFKL